MKLIFGDSHVSALKAAIGPKASPYTLIANHGKNLIDMQLDVVGDTLRVFADNTSASAPLDVTLTKGDRVVLSGPLHSSLVSRHRFWKSTAPWTLHEHFPKRQLASGNFIKTLAQDRTASMIQLLETATSAGISVAVLEPPRLSRRALMESGIDERVLVHVDETYRAEVRALVEAIGTAVIDTPKDTHDGAFMRASYQAMSDTDVHHGNKDYGILALANAAAFLDDETSGAADAKTTADAPQTDTPQTAKGRKSILQKLLKA